MTLANDMGSRLRSELLVGYTDPECVHDLHLYLFDCIEHTIDERTDLINMFFDLMWDYRQ
jgi:hypothetical protein